MICVQHSRFGFGTCNSGYGVMAFGLVGIIRNTFSRTLDRSRPICWYIFHNVKYCSLNVLEFCYIIYRPCLLDYLYHSYISCNLHTYNTTKKKREKLKNKLKNILNNKRRKKGRE